jgi:hypothetical protein
MKMVAGIVLRREVLRVLRIPHGFVKIGNTVEDRAGANPLIHCIADLIARIGIISAALIRCQRGANYPYAMLMGLRRNLRNARSSGVLSHAASNLHQPVADYFQSNIHCTTSGYFTLPPLRCAFEVVGINRLLFSVDYPYSSNMRGRAFLDSLPEALGPDDIAKLTHRNADHLLNLRPAA